MSAMFFQVTPEQQKETSEFMNNHECSLEDDPLGGKKVGAIGGRQTWCFTPTGLGEIVVIKCACGESKDLTDYNDW